LGLISNRTVSDWVNSQNLLREELDMKNGLVLLEAVLGACKLCNGRLNS